MKFLGYEFKKAEDPISKPEDLQTFSPPQESDGAMVVAAGGMYGHYVDLQGSAKTEAELVTKYRTIAMNPDLDMAIQEIVNEAIVEDPTEPIVKINLDRITTLSASVKKMIDQEFDVVLELLNMNTEAHDVFRQWYVDGRMYYHAVIDVKQPYLGIQEMRYVDPRKIRKVKEVQKKKIANTTATMTNVVNEYFVYNSAGYSAKPTVAGIVPTDQAGVRIAKDAIIHVTSGLLDETGTIVLSHLHKAIKPLNQLSVLEDATVIYRLARAPERRIFYIDVGNLPKQKAEQYLNDMMTRHKNRVVYDQSNGEVRDERKFMTMLEDYWLPRREGNRGTQIDTLPGGQNLGEMGDVEYFQKKLYNSLNVPTERLKQGESMFSLGKPAETTREEIKFAKFVSRLRTRFNQLFINTLGRQLVLKKILTSDEWQAYSSLILFEYAKDNYYTELKDLEVLSNRLNAVNAATPYAGKYISHRWIRTKILRQTEEELNEMDEEMEAEIDDPKYQPPEDPNAEGGAGGQDGDGEQPGGDQTQQIVDAIGQYVAQNGYDRTEVSKFVRDQFGVSYTDAYYYVDVYKNGQQ